MNKKFLAKALKLIVLASALCGIVLYGYGLPQIGKEIVEKFPEFSGNYWPWLVFLWMSGIPCYGVLLLVWKISASIQNDREFSDANSRRFHKIALLAAGDAVFFFAGNLILLFLNKNHPSILLASVMVCCFGAAVAVVSEGLAVLVQKAEDLQEQSDWTI